MERNLQKLLDAPVNLAKPRKISFRQRRPPRQIENLYWAEWASRSPHSKEKLTGIQAQGIKYEKKAGREVTRFFADQGAEIKVGPWIKFEDENGPGYAQPDILVIFEELVWIIECKLTYHPYALLQLQGLYQPLLKNLHKGVPQIHIVCCHNLTETEPGLFPPTIATLHEVMEQDSEYYIWHWLGL